MRKLLLSFLIGLSLMGLYMQYVYGLQQDISKNVLRLHILANSDSAEDQELKIKVRDKIVEFLSLKLNNDSTLEETRAIIEDNLDGIKQTALAEIAANNYSYMIDAHVGNYSFPTKYYENFALPKGRYDALRVTIGNGEGQNWWCVLYPNLCFVDGIATMPDRSMEKLEKVLTEDELSIVSNAPSLPVQIKFKFLELFSM